MLVSEMRYPECNDNPYFQEFWNHIQELSATYGFNEGGECFFRVTRDDGNRIKIWGGERILIYLYQMRQEWIEENQEPKVYADNWSLMVWIDFDNQAHRIGARMAIKAFIDVLMEYNDDFPVR